MIMNSESKPIKHRTTSSLSSDRHGISHDDGHANGATSAESPRGTSCRGEGHRILVAEDEATTRLQIQRGLVLDGYDVDMVSDGAEALNIYREGIYDLIILDINMPEMDGYAVCSELRKRTDVPIIIVTANSQTDEVVEGYKLGADIYVTKPFSPKELSARIGALLARIEKQQTLAENILTAGDISLNEDTHEVFVQDELVNLSPNEYSLLRFFLANPNVPVSNEALLETIWGYGCDEDANLVRVTIRRLRSKIERNPSAPAYLQTVRGVGYKFVTENASESMDSLLQ